MAGFIIFASGLHVVVFDDADSLGAGATGAKLGEHESKIYGINPSLIFLALRRCNAPNKPSTINKNPKPPNPKTQTPNPNPRVLKNYKKKQLRYIY